MVSGLYSFLGIRFAEPPIGQFRFRRPQYKRLEGDVNATVYGLPCPQPDSAGYIVGSEDCLWLNVYTPRMPDESTGLPVIVWIHGGGYRYGSANQYTVIPFKKINHQFLSKLIEKRLLYFCVCRLGGFINIKRCNFCTNSISFGYTWHFGRWDD